MKTGMLAPLCGPLMKIYEGQARSIQIEFSNNEQIKFLECIQLHSENECMGHSYKNRSSNHSMVKHKAKDTQEIKHAFWRCGKGQSTADLRSDRMNDPE